MNIDQMHRIAERISEILPDEEMEHTLSSEDGLYIRDWSGEYTAWLRGDKIVIWAGNDEDYNMTGLVEITR